MDTSPTSAAISRSSAVTGPCSVSLKMNATSVMLYRNRYMKGTQGKGGMSVQEYLCSFGVAVENGI